MQYFIREDGSTYHEVDFDPQGGEVMKKTILQGYNAESCWSRGQAWGICGFAIAYKYTKREEFLRTAEKLADYYIANSPPDYVPYWDFNDPKIPNTVKDSSAATITACGLLELFELSEENKFGDIALNILNSLCNNYLSEDDKEEILKHGCFHKPEGNGIDESLIWGDYYFMEALTKLIYSRKE
jgi:unsaturated chondroitin disaccharide hydrolase